MAKNNIYPAFETIYKRYAKVPVHIVAGDRVDPHDSSKNVGWTLSTQEESFDFDTKRRSAFVYEDEVIELYSELEDKLFKRMNKSLFVNGLLKEYNEADLQPDLTNFLTDEEINEIVELKSMTEFNKRLYSLTALSTLQRVREAAVYQNKPIKKIQAIDARIKAAQDDTD